MMKLIEIIENLKRSISSSISTWKNGSSSIDMSIDKQTHNTIDKNNTSENSNQTFGKQLIKLAAIVGIFIVSGMAYLNVHNAKSKKRSSSDSLANTPSQKIKVEVAAEALDPERMWRNHFEDKLEVTQENINTQLAKMSEVVLTKSEETRMQTKDEMKELKDQLNEARLELQASMNEIRELRTNKDQLDDGYKLLEEANLESQIIEEEYSINMPKDAKLYIPETSYVTGYLLAGISVSTSVGSSSEPVPVIIRLSGGGNLPKNFKTDLKECRILGSSYGDISSERAVVRAETMVCIDKISEEVITTKIAGIIYGDDGMNGIKGKVVDMSKKHIQSAAVGGMLSGFANTMKSQEQYALTAAGAFAAKQGFDERLQNNALGGMGNAAEKIANYYIKQAESMSPVLLIPGGARVDIVFTKGVYFGSNNIAGVIARERKENKNESR